MIPPSRLASRFVPVAAGCAFALGLVQAAACSGGSSTPPAGDPADAGTTTIVESDGAVKTVPIPTSDSGGSTVTPTPTGDGGTSFPPGSDDAGIPGATTGPGTTISGCEIFPPNNPWNVAVNGADVKVVTTYSEIPQTTALHPDFGGWTDGYGIPYQVVNGGQPEVATDFTDYASESDPGPGGWVGPNPVTTNASNGATTWPFYLGMEIEGNPSAGGTAGNLPGDQHGIVLQQGSNGCTAYEAWNCVVASSLPFVCANGAVFHLTSNALRPAGWTSADAAGLSVLAGLVRLAEVKAGTVTHAIRVTFNKTQRGYIPPATHAAGSESLGSAYPPMGLRLRLKSSVAITSYSQPSQVILKAMQTYGLMVADIGSDWFFQGDSDDGWNANAPDGKDTYIDEISSDFGKIKGSDFEVVYSGSPVATGL